MLEPRASGPTDAVRACVIDIVVLVGLSAIAGCNAVTLATVFGV